MIVAAKMADAEKGDVRVFNFILVASGGAEFAKDVAGLRIDAGAIVFAPCAGRGEIAKLRGWYGGRIGLRAASEGIGGKKTLDGIGSENVMVGLRAAELMMPVRAAGEVPAKVGTEIVEIVDLVEARRGEQSLPGNAGFAGVVAK